MKSFLVRLFLVISLAAPFSFAGGQAKPNHVNISAAKQQSECGRTEGKKQKKEHAEKKDKSQQEEEFDRMLMGIFG